MMSCISIIILLAFAAPASANTRMTNDTKLSTAHAYDLMDKFVERVVDRMLHRAINAWPLKRMNLDNMMLAEDSNHKPLNMTALRKNLITGGLYLFILVMILVLYLLKL